VGDILEWGGNKLKKMIIRCKLA